MEAYFYWGKNLGDVIYHSCVCLAEGFTEMGIACYSDFSNCLTGIGKDFLIKYDDKHSLSDADIVIIHYTIYERDPQADETLIRLNKKPRKYITVFLDDSDGLRTPGFRKGGRSCDIVLKSHYNKLYKYPQNFHPWQFGLCNRREMIFYTGSRPVQGIILNTTRNCHRVWLVLVTEGFLLFLWVIIINILLKLHVK